MQTFNVNTIVNTKSKSCIDNLNSQILIDHMTLFVSSVITKCVILLELRSSALYSKRMYSKLCHNVDYKVGFVLFLVYYQGDTEAYI